MQNLGWSGQIMAVGGTFLFLYFIWRAVKFFRERPIVLPPMFSPGNQHHWRSIDILTHTAYCNVCECLIVDGMHCDYCGLCVDLSCSKKANIKCRCKTLWYPEFVNEPMLHNWVRGNLAAHSLCDVCQEECGDESCLFDYRCCWCQRTVHEVNCFNTCKSSECDFGEWRRYMVPPFCIKYKTTWSKGRRKLVVDNVEKFHDEAHWFPLLVIANTKSGNNDGEKVLRAFRAILNPLQVIDLNEYSMEEGLEWCRVLLKNYKDADVRVLIAGGDGTIGWVLNTFEKLKLDPKPLVGILPLGTGNDLSKILGWGQSFSCESSLRHLMRKVLAAQMVSLDRWKIKLSPNRSLRLGIPLPSKNLFFNNYFSVGVDALVALEFHQTRESKIYNYLFNNRFFNKFLYLSYGTKDVLERKCKKLNEKIKLEIDGREIELPELESVVILNIPSWGGGAHIWRYCYLFLLLILFIVIVIIYFESFEL